MVCTLAARTFGVRWGSEVEECKASLSYTAEFEAGVRYVSPFLNLMSVCM